MKSKISNETILVTGAAGFIGFHISHRLLDEGWRVVGLDCMSDYYDVSLKEIAFKIANQSKPLAKLAKQAVNVAYETTLEEGIRSERSLFYSTFALDDHVEGMGAFSEKRKPIWKNK